MTHSGGEFFNSDKRISTPLTREKLVEMKRKAIRRGIWFSALNRTERACIDLTIKVVDRVRSLLLTKVLTAVVKKLSKAMENKITRLMREVGYGIALKISRIAQTWGYASANQWAMDLKFIRYLTMTRINDRKVYWA